MINPRHQVLHIVWLSQAVNDLMESFPKPHSRDRPGHCEESRQGGGRINDGIMEGLSSSVHGFVAVQEHLPPLLSHLELMGHQCAQKWSF